VCMFACVCVYNCVYMRACMCLFVYIYMRVFCQMVEAREKIVD